MTNNNDKLYGARETGGLSDGRAYHDEFAGAREVDWTAPGLRVTRLRLLSDPGFPLWDVSYCHGRIDNEPVVVRLGTRSVTASLPRGSACSIGSPTRPCSEENAAAAQVVGGFCR